MVIDSLWVYPLKGGAGMRVDEWELDSFGPVHDRRWMVVDGNGGFLSQRGDPMLGQVVPALEADQLVLRSASAGELRLPLGPAAGGEAARVRVWADEVAATDCGGDAAAFMTRHLGREARVVYMPETAVRPLPEAYAPHGGRVSFADAFPLLIIGDGSLDELNRRLDEPVEMVRFRPNVVVSGAAPHEEDGWQTIRLGEVECDVVRPCARCVVPTIDPATGSAGREPTRTLSRYRKWDRHVWFGQNAVHRAPGRLAVGARVDVLETRDRIRPCSSDAAPAAAPRPRLPVDRPARQPDFAGTPHRGFISRRTDPMEHRHVSRSARSVCAAALGLALIFPAAAQAQFTEAPAPAAYALRNVTVVRPDGSSEAGQTLIVRAGRIEALARDAAVPADARVLDGDTLYVYPGFVDAAGSIPFEFPRDTTDRSRVRSWDPPRTLQGFMPSRRVIDYVNATGDDGEDLRKDGIVAVAVHPTLNEPLMSGRGVLVLLRPDAESPQDLVLDPVLAPLMSLRGSRGTYPSTQMGVIAWYRQTFLDAQHRMAVAEARSANGAGPAPSFDADMDIVQELLRSNGRVYFAADDANAIRRVLGLAGEFGFRPVIVGGAEAWKVADELGAAEVPVLVSLDFPEPERWDPDEPEEDAASEPLAPAAARERKELEDIYANAGRLADAGVTFALVSAGSEDLREGVAKAIEYGLREADALRALTTTPAALLGVPQLAHVERGSAATFTVADRPVFSEDARILYTFVEGVLQQGATTERSGAGDASGDEPVNVAGTWTVEVLSPQTQTFTLNLTQDGNTVTGTIESPEGTAPVSGTISGAALALDATIQIGGQSFDIEINGDVNGDEASGVLGTSMGDIDWKARRTGPGARP